MLEHITRGHGNDDREMDTQTSSSHYSQCREIPSEGRVVDTAEPLRWLKATEVGRLLHQSSGWVRDRIPTLPPEMIQRSSYGHHAWLFHPRTITLLQQMI